MMLFAFILFTAVFGRVRRRSGRENGKNMEVGLLVGLAGAGKGKLDVGLLEGILCGLVTETMCKNGGKSAEKCSGVCSMYDDNDKRVFRRSRAKRELSLGSLFGGGKGINLDALRALSCSMIPESSCEKEATVAECPDECAMYGYRKRRVRQSSEKRGLSLAGLFGGDKGINLDALRALSCSLINEEACEKEATVAECPDECAQFGYKRRERATSCEDIPPEACEHESTVAECPTECAQYLRKKRRSRSRTSTSTRSKRGLSLGSLLGGGDKGINLDALRALSCSLISEEACEKEATVAECPDECARFGDPNNKRRRRTRGIRR